MGVLTNTAHHGALTTRKHIKTKPLIEEAAGAVIVTKLIEKM